MSLPDILDTRYLATKVIDFLPKLGAAVLVYLFFWGLERGTRPMLRGLLRRANINDALNRLLVDNVYRFVVLAFGIVMAASQLGINIAAALAGIGVAGIAVGFAAQESLSNMIAGFLIFWDRPFEVGDYISLNDQYGRVQDITMRTTRIRTQENTYAVVPNKQIIGEMLVNHSMYGQTRVNVPVGIA
jgi:small conductance mechanosensitive channel